MKTERTEENERNENLNNPNKKIGRPTKYKPEYAKEAYELCLLGYTNSRLAEHFEVNEDTIKEWLKVHPEFSTSVKEGKANADAKVAAALFKRATGYTYEENTYENGQLTRTVEKQMPPDAGAALNWLKNRQKELWRDKIESGFTDVNGNDRYAECSKEELQARIQELLRKAK